MAKSLLSQVKGIADEYFSQQIKIPSLLFLPKDKISPSFSWS